MVVDAKWLYVILFAVRNFGLIDLGDASFLCRDHLQYVKQNHKLCLFVLFFNSCPTFLFYSLVCALFFMVHPPPLVRYSRFVMLPIFVFIVILSCVSVVRVLLLRVLIL